MISSPTKAHIKKTNSARQTPMAVLRIVASLMLKSYVVPESVADGVALVADDDIWEVLLDILLIIVVGLPVLEAVTGPGAPL